MSDRSAFLSKTVIRNYKKGAVKRIISEFEHLGENSKTENAGMLRMGTEQSSLPKLPGNSRPTTISESSLVKQRVNLFDYKLESENQNDKKKRQKSVVENNRNTTNPTKDFQRSKSYDYVRKEKDRYSRGRLATPITKEEVFTFDVVEQKGDSNNNTSQRKNFRRKTVNETTKNENRKDNKTSLKLSRLESRTVAKQEQDKESKTEIKTARKSVQETTTESGNKKNNTTNPNISQQLEGSAIKKQEGSEDANSITKTVEKPVQTITENGNTKDNTTNLKQQQVEAPQITKQEVNKEGNSETKTATKDIETKSKITYRRPVRSVKSIKKIFENSQENPSTKPIIKRTLLNSLAEPNSNDKTVSLSDKEVSQDYAKVSENYSLEIIVEDNCKNISDEDNSILKENNTTDVSKNIIDNNSDKLSLEQNNLVDVTEENNSDTTYNYSEDEFNQIDYRFQEVEETLKEMEQNHSNTNLYEEEVISESVLEEPENIDVFIEKCQTDDELEDDFGKRSFTNIETINFTEAYNRDGDELIITSVAAVEHRSLSDSFVDEEYLLMNDYSNQSETLSITASTSKFEEERGVILEDTVSDGYSNFDTEKKLSLSADEIRSSETEIPSNRSTLYSSTTTNSSESMERYSKAESDDEGESEREIEHVYEEIRLDNNNFEIRNASSNGYDRTIKTETIYDSFKNPRIEKVSNVNSEEYAANTKSSTVEEVEPLDGYKSPTGLKPKKDYLIEELIDTEKKYIKHLEKVVWDYMPALIDEKLPPSLIGKSHYLFGNIKKIYTTTQSFYKSLKLCGTDHEEIAKTFLNFKYLFELYPLYSKNKPNADQYLLGDFKDVISAREHELNDRLGLASNLLTPIQRLGKYILFLDQIQKELSKKGLPSDNIYKAIAVVRKEMSRGNDYLAIDSIKACPFSLLEQGSFLMRNNFTVIKPRKYEAVLFLFEEMLVFTTVDPKDQEKFIYKDSINLNELGVKTSDSPTVFTVRRFPLYKTNTKQVNEFEIEAKKYKDKKAWSEQIEKRLWDQLLKCKEQQKEMHKNQGKRTSVMELPEPIRRKKSTYSSLPPERRKNSRKSIFYYKVDRDA